MTQGLDRGTLDRLIALGRSRGAITADDLRTALPVERMDVDALVLVMLELEAAGVSVEPEAVGPPANRPVSTAVELPAPKLGTPPDRATEAGYGAATFAAPGSAAAAPPEPIPDDRADASRAVILAGLATVLILGAVLLML
ncbi:RNA polymerase sigma factor region1.1 domain-containing protein [Methylobacterium sp. 391_Methyba4]|uniref:RNA polymerase sigma factor region1.1 domain-containing protein n=1 Tax=Methylobacterium sp. 391_Methyba4 TaxID=3038924 RepID=UPI002420311F|nr:RNA polymerase sigma factor region1.1 domain-containing protein [Methylobacterium sp. 391_Methyba4]WFS09216.1 RNA polymerase sigma factor region1.1 domain-containing protein [Methylobacterium sp. 391_Methyba4]